MDGHIELPITGMTCASCANRIERKLNRMDGVHATVNYATEKAAVAYDPALVAPADLVATVTAVGYGASLPADEPQAGPEADPLRARLVWTAALSVPVVALAMIPALQFRGWQWLSMLLATPVVFWAGSSFHRATLANLRHATATMDTLITVGTLAAWSWSMIALIFGGAGGPGMKMDFELLPSRSPGLDHIYFEIAWHRHDLHSRRPLLRGQAKRRAGAALTALLELGASDVALLGDDGEERRLPIGELGVGDRFVVRPGEKVATDGVVEEGSSAVDKCC